MIYRYEYRVFKGLGKRHVTLKCSLSTKQVLTSFDAMLYCQQKAIDNQINPETVSLYCITTCEYVYQCNSLVNAKL